MTLKKALQKSILPMPTPEESAKAAEEHKYRSNLWQCAEQIGIQPEEIEAETKRLKGLRKLRYGSLDFDLDLSDKALENLILAKTKNQKIQDEFVTYVRACIQKRKYEAEHNQYPTQTPKKNPRWKIPPIIYSINGHKKGR